MIFNAIYRLPIWKTLDTNSRNIRVLVLGLILYIIIYTIMYTKYVDEIEIIKNYRQYLYYIVSIDLVITSAFIFSNDKPNNKKSKKTKKKVKKNIPNQQQILQQIPHNIPNNIPKNIPQQIPHNIPNNTSNNIPNNTNEPIDNNSIDIPIYQSANTIN